VVDLLICLTGLVTAAPAMAAVSIAIRVRMGTPILFPQTRVRLEGELLERHKFRTMVDEVMPDGLAQLERPTAPDATVLDVGCGAGDLTLAMQEKGRRVVALDASPGMVEHPRKRIDALTASWCTSPRAAIGPLPWLQSSTQALFERYRVIRPGGARVIAADNARRLRYALDLRLNLRTSGLRRSVRVLLERLGLKPPADGPSPLLHAPDD
jgi:SAM-dependent methyltransferase